MFNRTPGMISCLHSGAVIVICAPSGTGKTTLIQRLRKEFPNIGYSISYTTRPSRKNEVDGKDYHFISQEEFIFRKNNKEFAEWAYVHGYFYGTLYAPVITMLNEGQDILFDIDVQGAAQLRLTIPYSKYIFVLPPTIHDLEKRLRLRGTDNEETIQNRMTVAIQEIRQAHWFDAWIINEHLDKAYDELRSFYLASKLDPKLQPALTMSIIETWSNSW